LEELHTLAKDVEVRLDWGNPQPYKFGPLSADASTKVGLATSEQLDAWLDALLDAATLDSVFANH
jgi:hypothetical protein